MMMTEGEIGLVITQLVHAGLVPEACGSRVTCNPAPRDTDADFLIDVSANVNSMTDLCESDEAITRAINVFASLDFQHDGAKHYREETHSKFTSWRYRNINLLLTANRDWAAAHRVATGLCKRLNLLHKADRIAVFQAVLYGKAWPPETSVVEDGEIDL